MKKIITLLMGAILSIGASAHTTPIKVVGTPSSIADLQLAKKSYNLPQTPRLTRAEGVEVHANFSLDASRLQTVFSFLAVPVDVQEDGRYEGEALSDTEYGIALPAGTYDFLAIIDEDAAAERIILCEAGVDVKDGMPDLEFDVADATYSTRIQHTDSNGEKLTLPSYTEPSNCTCGMFFDFIFHNGYMAWIGGTIAYMECNYIMSTNMPDSPFSIVRADMIGAETEGSGYIIPVDYNKEISGPTSSEGWQTNEQTVMPTPLNIANAEYYANLGAEDNYTFISGGIMVRGEWWGPNGLGVFDMKCNSGKIAIWAAEDGFDLVEMMMMPSGDVFSGDDSSVTGMPLKRGDNGLEQIGVNFVTGNRLTSFASTPNFVQVSNPFSRYTGEIQAKQIGNCTPLLMASTDLSGFFYTYKGRYGETLSIDDFDIYDVMDDEGLIQQPGGRTSDIKIYANDKLICSSRSDLPWGVDWIDGADNRAEITMKNVLIDGEIPGCNTAVIRWNADKGNGFAPTFTSLQFRDTDDKIADRFQKSADGVIEFTVADFSVEYNDVAQIVHFPIHEVESVKAEYAPHGSSDYLPIEVAEVPELFYSPGYGYFFRGSLASIDRPSIDGWFDLRLTATNAVGASIQQVISPAFHIEERTGVSSINADSDLFYTIDGRNITLGKNARIYNMDGRQCSPTVLAPGLYIISNGNASEKVVIR